MKTKILIMFAVTMVCVIILVTLYANSPLSKPMYRASFVRNYATPLPSKVNDVSLGVNSYYLAGVTSTKIYLGNYRSPFHLLEFKHDLTDSQHVKIKIPFDSIASPRAFRLSIDSPFFFISNGIAPRYLRGRIGEWIATTYLEGSMDYSVEALPIGDKLLVLRAVSKLTGEYELGYRTNNHKISFKYDLLQKQIDGLFCLDGKLLYDKKSNSIVYVHNYKNEIIVTDSTLNLKYRFHTIDTFSKARLQIAKLSGPSESMLTGPPSLINVSSAIDGASLYVQSNLLSKDESEYAYKHNTVIDTYDLKNGQYIRSFYIPIYNKRTISSFLVNSNFLYAIIEKRLFKYRLPPVSKRN